MGLCLYKGDPKDPLLLLSCKDTAIGQLSMNHEAGPQQTPNLLVS